MSEKLINPGEENGKNGPQGNAAAEEEIDKTKKFIVIDDKTGWVSTRIHITQGLYNIVGFHKEVEDNLRYFYTQKRKEEQEKINLAKPGFRGFNMKMFKSK